MPRRKAARRTTMKDIRAILRLSYAEKLSVRDVAERLKISRTSVSTYLLRAREAGITCWPPLEPYNDAAFEKVLFRKMGRPPRDLAEPDWAMISRELKRKGVTRALLWEEYRTAHPNGYGYTWFCEGLQAFEQRRSPSFRNRFAAGAVMQTDYAGQTVPIFDLDSGRFLEAQIFVAVLGASSYTFAYASFSQALPDWIEGQCRARGPHC